MAELRKIGRRGKVWQKARKRLKKEFEQKGITHCEICGSTFALSFHHRHKRRYGDKHDFENVILLCATHHQELEHNRTLTKSWFDKLRGIVS